MICPYCNDKMKSGRIDVYDNLSWTPDGESRKGSTKYAIAKNGVMISKYHLLFPASKEAFYCPSCKKIIMEI